ncbi:hypothetical protein MMC20_005645 [Loxospora ochrophaea]|nr:hypothetical protein [Loxospora ochrophaea]
MLSLRAFLLTALLATRLFWFAQAEPSEDHHKKHAGGDIVAFQKLLEQVDPPSLHAALHHANPEKFKDGVFQEDRTAVEAVHSEDASLATSILALARRQLTLSNSSTSAVSSVDASTITSAIGASTAPNPVQSSGADTQGASPVPQSGSGTISTGTLSPSLSSGEVFTTTNAAGIVVVTTVDGGVVTLSSSLQTTASGLGKTSGTKTTGPVSSETSVILHTTTLPDGGQSTITAVTVIPAGGNDAATASGTAGGGTASGTTGASPGLQTGLAPKSRSWGWEVAAAIGGAMGVAMMM